MDLEGTNPVYDALNAVHADESVFSMGVSDSPDGVALYVPGRRTGVLVTGKPDKARLPAPFNQVRRIKEHEIHHKFVVCGFAGDDPVVYCGSSNLALGGEENNGDNLLELHDPTVVTAFAIEALALIDSFQFLDGLATSAGMGCRAVTRAAAGGQGGGRRRGGVVSVDDRPVDRTVASTPRRPALRRPSAVRRLGRRNPPRRADAGRPARRMSSRRLP